MSGMMYGYARVSTRGQREDRQVAALQEFGVALEHITVEKQSGKILTGHCISDWSRCFVAETCW